MDFKSHTTLGRTGLSVSRLGLASGYGIGTAAVEKAYREFGINYFFWSTPRRSGMGDAIRNLARTDRDTMVIALQSYDHTGLLIERSVEKGLKALGIDHADILTLGWHNSVPMKRILAAAEKLKSRGLIGHVGMSGHTRSTFGKLAADPGNPVDVFMVRYNAAHTGAEKDIFPFLAENKRPGVTVYTATCWRKLMKQGKMPPGEAPLSAADCYRFVLSNPKADLCLFGPSSEKEMLEGLTALEKGPLSGDEMKRIRKIGRFIHEGPKSLDE
jgi:aryl-alcohol dehydrogenase-like predicted oxidoreductase